MTSKESSYRDSIKLSRSQQEEQEKLYKIVRSYNQYNSFTENRQEEFKTRRIEIQNILVDLINKGTLGTNTSITSRIKSYQSTMRNKMRGKSLDDIFGITILINTPEEVQEIENRLKDIAKVIKLKRIDETRFEKYRYKATHILLEFEKQNPKTQLEVHLQTKQDAKEAFPHMEYKLLHDKNIEESRIALLVAQRYIQEMYDKKSNRIRLIIPDMWEAEFDQEKKEFCERKLEDNEILKKMYPFLQLNDEGITH